MHVYMQSRESKQVFRTSSPEYHKDCERISTKEGKRLEREQSISRLKTILRPGSTVYTVLRHVSRSGMQRRIDLYAIDSGELVYLSGYAANAMGYPSPEDGIRVTGCGMDMGFHLVSTLGAYLWPKGTDTPHGTRNGEPDSDGGYALKHRWI